MRQQLGRRSLPEERTPLHSSLVQKPRDLARYVFGMYYSSHRIHSQREEEVRIRRSDIYPQGFHQQLPMRDESAPYFKLQTGR